jgi:membrane peptidoglycan carboxypeptidase
LIRRIGGGLALLLTLYIGWLWISLPNISDPRSFLASQSSVIVDRNGTELYRLFNSQDRTYVTINNIAPTIQKAIVAIEDSRFYTRSCIDTRALARAVLRAGQRGGGSTLTRQLARNALDLNSGGFLSRKLRELFLGCKLESQFSREQLLELYLNWIPFGQNAYGVEQASHRYFSISAKDLSIAQAAVLASLPQQPSYLNPYGKNVHTRVSETIRNGIQNGSITSTDQIDNRDVDIGLIGTRIGSGVNALYVGGRTDQVLHNMVEQGMITESERLVAVSDLQKIIFTPTREDIRAPHFVLWAKDTTDTLLNSAQGEDLLRSGGLQIQTTLDWNLQKAAEDIVARKRDGIREAYGAHNIALVAMDPRTREILAYVGNADFSDTEHSGKFDMAQAPRQPGSSFKPFVYLSAFSKGYAPASIFADVPTKFGGYEPQNFDGQFWGMLSARKALGGSRNIPAVKAYFLGGQEETILDEAAAMGMPSLKQTKPANGYGPALALGAGELPLVELVQGYATLANNGKILPPVAISKITNSKGVLLHQAEATEAKEVIDPRLTYLITSILSDPSARPTEFWSSALTVPGTQAAAKTGTSNACLKYDEKKINCVKRKPNNVWTLGYTPDLVVGVWIGNADSTPLYDTADGLNVAAPIWREFLTEAVKIRKPTATSFRMPEGLVQPQISLLSGQLPTDCTPIAMRGSDVFLRENAPTELDPSCSKLTVDRVTNLLSSTACPESAQEERSFFTPFTAGGTDYPNWQKSVVDWASTAKVATGSTLIGLLPLAVAPTQACDPSLTPGRLVQPTLEILKPTSGGSVPYPAFLPQLRFTVGSSIHEVRYAVDGKTLASITERPFEKPIRVPRSISKEGTHTLSVTLVDEYFNEVTTKTSFQFSTDSSAPDVQILSPTDGANVPMGANIKLSASASDPEAGLKIVEFFIDDTLITRRPSEPYSVDIPASLIKPGSHQLRVMATGLSGLTGQDEISITVGDTSSSSSAQ